MSDASDLALRIKQLETLLVECAASADRALNEAGKLHRSRLAGERRRIAGSVETIAEVCRDEVAVATLLALAGRLRKEAEK